MSFRSKSRSNGTLKNELKELQEDCKDSPYWTRKPRPREFKVENEKKETYYDNLVIQSLKEYDNICGQKFGKKVCFQKHCSHNQTKETQRKETVKENNQQIDPINLLLEAAKYLEEQNDQARKVIKLVDYEITDDEAQSPDTIVSEIEEELITGQAPMYLPLAGFFGKV